MRKKALSPDPQAIIPRISLGEQGVLGLKISNKRVMEETTAAFRYPQFIRTVNEMRNNPTVGAAMNVYRMMISRVKWDVEAPKGASPKELERVKAIRTMMGDMEHSWGAFIESIVSYLEYGFAINEIVLRRRLKRNGSKYQDGLVGIKKLAPRSQDTIVGWMFSETGDDLVGVEQTLLNVENAYRYRRATNERGNLEIDREKFLLFTASPTKGNPEGNSIYKNIYLSFKQLTLLQDQELVGIAKDVQGILKIAIPPRYLDPNASPEDKAAVAAFQSIIDNYNAGTQRGLLVPNMTDPESKLPLFTYELLESRGSAKYDTESIIRRLQSDILTALSVDVLKLGSEGSGSFSLAESKSSILTLAIDYRLKEISEVLNSHLMRTIYTMNGWETDNLPMFVYSDIEDVSTEEFSKAIQRVFSVGAVEVDREILNRVRKILGVPELPDDEPVNVSQLPANLSSQQTRSGDGMAVGTTGNGTATDGLSGSGDTSTSNQEN